MVDWGHPWAPILALKELLERVRDKLRKVEIDSNIIYCGGVRTKYGHHESRRDGYLPSEGEMKITKRTVWGPKVIDYDRKVELKPYKKPDRSIEILRAKWYPLILKLESSGSVRISKHTHYGGMRGIDIVRKAKTELRRMGYEIEINLRGHDGVIILRCEKAK